MASHRLGADACESSMTATSTGYPWLCLRVLTLGIQQHFQMERYVLCALAP